MEHISQEERSDHNSAQGIVLETMSWQPTQKCGAYSNERDLEILISDLLIRTSSELGQGWHSKSGDDADRALCVQKTTH